VGHCDRLVCGLHAGHLPVRITASPQHTYLYRYVCCGITHCSIVSCFALTELLAMRHTFLPLPVSACRIDYSTVLSAACISFTTCVVVCTQVSQFASVLQSRYGVVKGDRVLIYMPMIPEAIVAMLACARIGAIHSLVFGGFASKQLATRINHAEVDPAHSHLRSCACAPIRSCNRTGSVCATYVRVCVSSLVFQCSDTITFHR